MTWLITWPSDNAMLFSLIVLGILIALVAVLHRAFHEKLATIGVSILIPVVITLVLNHVLAESRDRESRRWTLRQEHLHRLQSILRADASKLDEVAKKIRSTGRVTSMFADAAANEVEFQPFFFPDVLSGDLHNHFGAYSAMKDRLRLDTVTQEREFDETASMVSGMLHLAPDAAQFGNRSVALAVLEKCTDRGPGLVMKISGGTISYAVPGRGGSIGGTPDNPARPWPELQAAFRAFTTFRANAAVTEHCARLTARAKSLAATAEKLSAEARLLAERTTLSGDCEYTRLD